MSGDDEGHGIGIMEVLPKIADGTESIGELGRFCTVCKGDMIFNLFGKFGLYYH